MKWLKRSTVVIATITLASVASAQGDCDYYNVIYDGGQYICTWQSGDECLRCIE